VFNYQISRFYTRVITRTAHALPTNTTHRLHAFYARVGAAIPLTGTVYGENYFVVVVLRNHIKHLKLYSAMQCYNVGSLLSV